MLTMSTLYLKIVDGVNNFEVSVDNWVNLEWQLLSTASRVLLCYGLLMAIALLITYAWSLNDYRLIREVGIWVKPMKFMSATALFAMTTLWLIKVANSHVDQTSDYNWIVALLISTSLFEVVYISYQASKASASHYNISDPYHAFMFGVMTLAAVGLTSSQAWLAWEIWKEQSGIDMPVESLGVITGLVMTFTLSTISGFMLGGNQPPVGQGLPIVGWHLHKDIRPPHFLGVHAQQLIPIWGLITAKFMGSFAHTGLLIGIVAYFMIWLTWTCMSL